MDKWLWCARFFKTRTLATRFINGGVVRLTRNGATSRIDKAAAAIRAGDELCFPLADRVRVIRVLACATRRGPAAEARELYDDLSPPADREAPKTGRQGARPTKKDRRNLDAARKGFSDDKRR
ncbi:MAG: RNA-binding S4 domain-containing protein [Alphaproteobacteria bacterium]|nr:RNA-binding S4 domain-containing protein [Alphaproteobacteria bacterium]